jgi:hypothetical protein
MTNASDAESRHGGRLSQVLVAVAYAARRLRATDAPTSPPSASNMRLHPEEAGILTAGGGSTVKSVVSVAVFGTESDAVITSV